MAGDGVRRAPAAATAVLPANGDAEAEPAVVLPPRATAVPEAPARPPVARYVLAGAVVIASFFGGFGAWAGLAPLASAALASGRVVVESSRKTVQHLEGGIIEEILVRAGDKVQAGQLLLTLAPIQAGAKVDALSRELTNLRAAQARLQAHLQGAAAPEFPPDLREQAGDPLVGSILRAQAELFTTAKTSLEGQISVLEQRAGQLESQIRGLREQITSSDRQLSLLAQQRKDIGFLVEQQLARKSQLFELDRQIASVSGQRGNDRQRVEEARKAIGEVRSQVISLKDEFVDKQAQELDKVRSQIAEMTQSLKAAEDVLQRLEVRAPVAGTVVNPKYFTKGGVVAPGQPILEIVPTADRLVIEVRISPLDIDSVRPGLSAELRLTALNSRTTPLVPGELALVAADLLEDERTGQPYYVGQINVAPEALARLQDVKLYPGMPVDALIKLEDRTFIDYILGPFEQGLERAFRES
jgi:HlyD family type I secretion membrane fusion protein